MDVLAVPNPAPLGEDKVAVKDSVPSSRESETVSTKKEAVVCPARIVTVSPEMTE